MTNILQNIQRGPVQNPFKIVLYGLEGVGKSTFAADAPSPVFLDVEGGTEDLDVARLPKVTTFQGVRESIAALVKEKHDFKTFVLDTVDWLESLIWEHVCQQNKVASIEDIGYGKGYTAALELWRGFLADLDVLRARRGMHIILLAHSHIRGFRNPAGDDYERYELKLNPKASGLIKEWPSAVLFARYETYTHTDKNKRTRAVGDGSRIISTEPRPAWDAKNRYGLPEEIPLSWAEFESCARSRAPVEPVKATADLEELIALTDEKTAVQTRAGIKRCDGDPEKLAKLTDWLRGKVQHSAA
jgi:hypothetical protein